MRVVSVNVGLPRDVEVGGEIVRTSIFKSQVSGPVAVRSLNLDGDRQSDHTVHGGPDKAVYAYPSEHYAFWREELRGEALPWGAFGENLTTEGLSEKEVHVGDTLEAGRARFLVTQPRMPCFKLGVRFGRPDMVKRFLRSRRPGFYLKVLREGVVAGDDPIRIAARDPRAVAITDIVDMYVTGRAERDLLERVLGLEGLPESWKEYFQERIETVG